MVVVTLTPHRGNGARSFPHTGFLGISPVTFAGVVRTKLQEDKRPLEASSVVVRVRCYESLGASAHSSGSNASTGGPGTADSSPADSPHVASASAQASAYTLTPSASLPTSPFQQQQHRNSVGSATKGKVLWETSTRLWEPAEGSVHTRDPSRDRGLPNSATVEPTGSRRVSTHHRDPVYGDLGDLEKAFRLVIPPEAISQGARSTMIFKKWRIWWAIEAVIYHKPAGVHGDRIVKSQQVVLLNYGKAHAGSHNAPVQWSSTLGAGRVQPLEYIVTASSANFGSSDPVTFAVRLRRPAVAAQDVPRRVTIELRREVFVSAEQISPSPSQAPGLVNEKASRRRHHTGLERRQSGADASCASGFDSNTDSSSQEGLATPPLTIPTPIEYAETCVESYFGLFGPASTSQTTRHILSPSPSSPTQSRGAAAAAANAKKREDVVLAVFESELRSEGAEAWSCQVKGSMPKAKSLYHYALGESCSTSSAVSRFYFVVKIHYRQKNHFLELPHRVINFTTICAEEREKALEQLPRILAIQKAEAKVFGIPRNETDSADTRARLLSASPASGCDDPPIGSARRSTVRRRSDAGEPSDSPRTRLRVSGHMQELSPAISVPSPILSVGSPALSVASTVTQRPRPATRKNMQPSSASTRSLRPKSSGGFSTASVGSSKSNVSSASGHLVAAVSLSRLDLSASPIIAPKLGLAETEMTSDSTATDHDKVSQAAPACITFEGFTLRPTQNQPHQSQAEEAIPPKPGVVTRSQAKSRSKTSRTGKSDPESFFSYNVPVVVSYPAPAASGSSSSSGSSDSPMSLSRTSTEMSATSSTTSATSVMSSSAPSGAARNSQGRATSQDRATLNHPDAHSNQRRKSATSTLASFFRRNSKASL